MPRAPLALSEVIELIYEAAQNRVEWPAALDGIARLLQADIASLYHQDRHTKQPSFVGFWGTELAAVKPYADHFVNIDSRSLHMRNRTAGEVYRDDEQLSLRAVANCAAQNEFYRGMLGMEYVLGCHFGEGGGSTFSALRHAGRGNFSQADADLVSRALIPNLHRAFKIQRLLDRQKEAQSWNMAALEALPTALFILDERLRIVSANRAAEALAMDNLGLRIRQQTLLPTLKKDLERLAYLVRLSGLDQTLERPLPPPVLRLGVPPGLQLLVAPFKATSSFTRSFAKLSFVFVADPTKRRLPAPRFLVAMYGLTEAEALVVLAMADGGSLAAIAATRNVTIHTVRTLVKRAMAKVGAHSQAQLLATVMTGLGALGGKLLER